MSSPSSPPSSSPSSPSSSSVFLRGYEIRPDEIGRGRYGVVFSGIRQSDGLSVAVKRVNIFDLSNDDRRECLNEISSLQKVSHPNVISLIDSFILGGDLFLVTQFAEWGNLSSLIDDVKKKGLRFAEGDIWRFAYFIAEGIQFLHSLRIIHRDIKPKNIFLTATAEVKIGDLGLSRAFSTASQSKNAAKSIVGTPFYMPPEVIGGSEYSYSADVWALGILLYEVSQLRIPFDFDEGTPSNLFALGRKILNGQFKPIDEVYSEKLKTLIGDILQTDPQKRPSAKDIAERAKNAVICIQNESEGKSSDGVPKDSPPPSSSPVPSSSPSASSTRDPFLEYDDLGVIGRGAHSVVHKARHRSSGEIVAIKRVAIFDMDSDARRECINETQILSQLPPHPNIIRYIDSGIFQNDLFLILELAEGGDIQRLIESQKKTQKPFSEESVWGIFSQVAQALNVMHKCRCMHRDIKPSNCFVTSGHQIKLGDLGLGRYLSSKTLQTFSVVGTPFYMSPENISSNGYSFASDCWALGTLLYELAALRNPFDSPNLNYYTLGNKIKNAEFPRLPSPPWSPTLVGLINSMIVPQAERRIPIDLVTHVAEYAVQCFENQRIPQWDFEEIQRMAKQHEETQGGNDRGREDTDRDRGGDMGMEERKGQKQNQMDMTDE